MAVSGVGLERHGGDLEIKQKGPFSYTTRSNPSSSDPCNNARYVGDGVLIYFGWPEANPVQYSRPRPPSRRNSSASCNVDEEPGRDVLKGGLR
jgi:hypothetical protein